MNVMLGIFKVREKSEVETAKPVIRQKKVEDALLRFIKLLDEKITINKVRSGALSILGHTKPEVIKQSLSVLESLNALRSYTPQEILKELSKLFEAKDLRDTYRTKIDEELRLSSQNLRLTGQLYAQPPRFKAA